MSVFTVPRTLKYYRNLEKDVFSRIPGMTELVCSNPNSRSDNESKYPDATFALMVADNLLCGDREQSAINQRAYTSILKGESISSVRFRHDKEMQAYVDRHMWDD